MAAARLAASGVIVTGSAGEPGYGYGYGYGYGKVEAADPAPPPPARPDAEISA